MGRELADQDGVKRKVCRMLMLIVRLFPTAIAHVLKSDSRGTWTISYAARLESQSDVEADQGFDFDGDASRSVIRLFT